MSQKLHKAKDSLSDTEKKVEQLTQHLKESVVEQKGLEHEKHQAGADYIRQEKSMQAKFCHLQEQKNEMKVSVHLSTSLHMFPARNPSGFPPIPDLSAEDGGGA